MSPSGRRLHLGRHLSGSSPGGESWVNAVGGGSESPSGVAGAESHRSRIERCGRCSHVQLTVLPCLSLWLRLRQWRIEGRSQVIHVSNVTGSVPMRDSPRNDWAL